MAIAHGAAIRHSAGRQRIWEHPRAHGAVLFGGAALLCARRRAEPGRHKASQRSWARRRQPGRRARARAVARVAADEETGERTHAAGEGVRWLEARARWAEEHRRFFGRHQFLTAQDRSRPWEPRVHT